MATVRDIAELAEALDLLRHLDAELAGRGQDQRLHPQGGGIDLLDDRDPERCGLAGAGLRLADEVLAEPQRRDRLCLDLGRGDVAHALECARDGDGDLDLTEAVLAGAGEDGGEQRRLGVEGIGAVRLRAHRLVGRALGGRALPRARSARLRFRLRGGIGLWQTVLQWFE